MHLEASQLNSIIIKVLSGPVCGTLFSVSFFTFGYWSLYFSEFNNGTCMALFVVALFLVYFFISSRSLKLHFL